MSSRLKNEEYPNMDFGTSEQFSKSDIFGVLQNDRRRNVLQILNENGGQSLRSISEDIARIEAGSKEPASNLRKSIYISLHQTHLPKMEQLGIISYDREKDLVKLLPAAQDFNFYLETDRIVKKEAPLNPSQDMDTSEPDLPDIITENNRITDIPWSLHYTALSIISMLGITAIENRIVNFISITQWALSISCLVFIVSIIEIKENRIQKEKTLKTDQSEN